MSYNMDLTSFGEYENLFMNLFSGVLPEHLTQEEVQILKNKHGENWFEELGYSEPEFKKPKF